MVRAAFSSGGPPPLAGHAEASRSSRGHGSFTANAALGTLLATSPRPVPAFRPSGRHQCRDCPRLTAIEDTPARHHTPPASAAHPLPGCRPNSTHRNSSIIAYIENGITM